MKENEQKKCFMICVVLFIKWLKAMLTMLMMMVVAGSAFEVIVQSDSMQE